jgi:hypothetical protein
MDIRASAAISPGTVYSGPGGRACLSGLRHEIPKPFRLILPKCAASYRRSPKISVESDLRLLGNPQSSTCHHSLMWLLPCNNLREACRKGSGQLRSATRVQPARSSHPFSAGPQASFRPASCTSLDNLLVHLIREKSCEHSRQAGENLSRGVPGVKAFNSFSRGSSLMEMVVAEASLSNLTLFSQLLARNPSLCRMRGSQLGTIQTGKEGLKPQGQPLF